MKNKIFIFGLSVLMIGLCSGCATFFKESPVDYGVNVDSAIAVVDVSYFRAYDASLEAIREMGGISEDNKSEGWIKTQMHHHQVAVRVEKMTDGTVQVTVSAKRYDVPKSQYALDILAKIVNRIKQQPLWLR